MYFDGPRLVYHPIPLIALLLLIYPQPHMVLMIMDLILYEPLGYGQIMNRAQILSPQYNKIKFMIYSLAGRIPEVCKISNPWALAPCVAVDRSKAKGQS